MVPSLQHKRALVAGHRVNSRAGVTAAPDRPTIRDRNRHNLIPNLPESVNERMRP